MKILIFCSLQEEALPIARVLALKRNKQNRQIYEGMHARHFLQMAITGMGKENTFNICNQYLKNFLPDVVLSCGFAGGLSPVLRMGDMVMARKILLCEHKNFESVLEFNTETSRFNQSLKMLFSEVFMGDTLTTGHVIDRAQNKKDIGKKFGALSVDMESGFIAQYLEKSGLKIPFFNIRVISDSVDEDMEIDFTRWIDDQGKSLKWPILFVLLGHPQKMKYIWNVAVRARKSIQKLAHALSRFIENLPISPNS